VGSDLLDSELTVLGGITNVIARRILQKWESLSESVDRLQSFVNAQRGLAEPGKSGRIPNFEPLDIRGRLHERDMPGRLARGSLHFLVPSVSDQQDL